VVSECRSVTEARTLASLSYCQPDAHKPPPWYTDFMWWKAVYNSVQLEFVVASLSPCNRRLSFLLLQEESALFLEAGYWSRGLVSERRNSGVATMTSALSTRVCYL